MKGASNSTFMKAIADGIVKPQLVKERKKAMYLESKVLKAIADRIYNCIINKKPGVSSIHKKLQYSYQNLIKVI